MPDRPRGATGLLRLHPRFGRVELRTRADLRHGMMAAFWLGGLEDRPDRCAEVCVIEVFGSAVEPGRSAEIGMGLHAFRAPDAVADFAAVRLPIDVAGWHDYALAWQPERANFLVEGELVRSVPGPPGYPMQLMLAVFDFPEEADGTFEPSFEMDRVRVH